MGFDSCQVYASLNISICILISLAYIFQIVRVYYCRKTTQNKLSLFPYYVMLTYLVMYLIQSLLTSLWVIDDPISKNTFLFTAGSITCFFWVTVVILTTFEWAIITRLINFQANLED
jgi:hypothetical protein